MVSGESAARNALVVTGTVARPPGASKTEHFAGSATVPTGKLSDLLCDRSGNFTRLDSKGGSCYKGEKKKLKCFE
jgi:hypothetical protein